MSTSTDLKTRKAAAVPNGVSTKGIYVARAENSEVWDVDGRRYVDFAAGIAVLNTGHRHPKIMAAVAEQALAFTHTCFHVVSYESYVRLALTKFFQMNKNVGNMTSLVMRVLMVPVLADLVVLGIKISTWKISSICSGIFLVVEVHNSKSVASAMNQHRDVAMI